MELINGTIERIIFRNDENNYTVISFENDDGLFTGVGIINSPYIGEILKLSGEWTNHPRFGTQFKFESYEIALPKTKAQIMAYLSSGILPGVRQKTAKALVACKPLVISYGSSWLATLIVAPKSSSG